MKYCSQCKKSKYTIVDGRKRLRCRAFVAAECDEFLTTRCTYALDCEHFSPERAEYRPKKEWHRYLKICGIDKSAVPGYDHWTPPKVETAS